MDCLKVQYPYSGGAPRARSQEKQPDQLRARLFLLAVLRSILLLSAPSFQRAKLAIRTPIGHPFSPSPLLSPPLMSLLLPVATLLVSNGRQYQCTFHANGHSPSCYSPKQRWCNVLASRDAESDLLGTGRACSGLEPSCFKTSPSETVRFKYKVGVP